MVSVNPVTKALLIIHVLAAILAVGPIAVAASMFPATARKTLNSENAELGTLKLLNRICRVYALIGIAVPFFGFATAGMMHVMGSPWVIVSIALTAVAAGVLALLILPVQGTILAMSGASIQRLTTRLAMLTGIFNLLWAAVTAIMIIRPGSTTGV